MVIDQLPICQLREVSKDFTEFNPPGTVDLLHRGFDKTYLQTYGLAHAFIGLVENAQVIGSGSLVVNDHLIVHGLSTGNYGANIKQQLSSYESLPDGGVVEDECILSWGHKNFGHWLFTYLQRLTLLWYKPELRRLPILLPRDLPRKYLEWLREMGLEKYIFADDGVKVRKLWVPSVLCYRGQFEDMNPYVYPEALHILRKVLLKDLELPRPKKRKLYISRAQASYRNLENEDEVATLLAKNGYERVFMGSLTLDKQLDYITSASHIFIHAGGDSPITMLAPRNCRIVELTIPQFVGTFASVCWADILGQEFHRINCKPTKKTGTLHIDMDSICPIEEIKALL